jgi:hypothetical protein
MGGDGRGGQEKTKKYSSMTRFVFQMLVVVDYCKQSALCYAWFSREFAPSLVVQLWLHDSEIGFHSLQENHLHFRKVHGDVRNHNLGGV